MSTVKSPVCGCSLGSRDDDDYVVLTLARCPEILPVVIKQAEIKVHLYGSRANMYETVRTAAPVRKGNGTKELWDTTPR